MEKENKVLTVITFINLVMICLCIIGCMYGIATTRNVYYIIDSLVEVVALVAAVAYFAMGYKKDAAKYYKMFMLFMAATYVVEYLLSFFITQNDISGIYTAFSLILYGNTLLLAVAKDLGKKVTISIASFNLVVYFGTFLGSCFKSYPTQTYKIDMVLMAATWFALAGITLLMTIAKYIDKAQRNTK